MESAGNRGLLYQSWWAAGEDCEKWPCTAACRNPISRERAAICTELRAICSALRSSSLSVRSSCSELLSICFALRSISLSMWSRCSELRVISLSVASSGFSACPCGRRLCPCGCRCGFAAQPTAQAIALRGRGDLRCGSSVWSRLFLLSSSPVYGSKGVGGKNYVNGSRGPNRCGHGTGACKLFWLKTRSPPPDSTPATRRAHPPRKCRRRPQP